VVLSYAGPNSKAGCMLCNCMKGVSRKKKGFYINKIVNIGHRRCLPADHILRHFGVSGGCCPEGYYDGSAQSIKDLLAKLESDDVRSTLLQEAADKAIEKLQKAGKKADHIVPARMLLKPQIYRRGAACDKFQFRQYDHGTRFNNMLFNSDFQISDFQDEVWFAHCDFSKPLIYRRHSDDMYRALPNPHDADEDDEGESDFITEIEDQRIRHNVDLTAAQEASLEQSKEASIFALGVHDAFVFDELPSARIPNAIHPDPFHALLNLLKNILFILIGSRATEFPTLRLCRGEGRFPNAVVPAPVYKPAKTIAVADSGKTGNANLAKQSSVPPPPPIVIGNQNDATVSKHKRKLRWLLKTICAIRADTFHNCINYPIGMSDKFCSKNPFGTPGYLKGHDKIQMLTTLINFDLHFTKLAKEYKNLIAMISAVCCDLCSVVIESDLEDPYLMYMINVQPAEMRKMQYAIAPVPLFNRMVEALSFFEGMLPDSECQFTHHELVDICFSLKSLGPIRNWWAYGPERFMQTVTNLVPDGGQNELMTISNYHSAEERSARCAFQEDTSHLDNKGRYRDNMVKLHRKNNVPMHLSDVYWSGRQQSYLMKAIYVCLFNLKSDCRVQSPFYRLYTAYKAMKRTVEFCVWLSILEAADDDTTNLMLQCSGLIPERNINLYNVEVNISGGCIYEIDLDVIGDILNIRPNEIFEQAHIKGLLFRGRGAYCTEVDGPTDYVDPNVRYGQQINTTQRPSNKFNDLRELWDDPQQFSSFFKMVDMITKASANKALALNAFQYGQLNYFFRVLCPGDSVLHGLPVANVVMWHTTNDDDKIFMPKIKIATSTSSPFDWRTQFVALKFILSTRVGSCGVLKGEKDWEPILVASAKSDCMNDKQKFYSADVRAIEELFLLDLEPNRKNVDISHDDLLLFESFA
jgi:hypothetical protein